MSTKNTIKTHENHSVIDEYWGKDAIAFGWTAIPNSLLMLQGRLKIGSTEMCILMHIMMHQWPEHGDAPAYPSMNTIALRMGVTKRTIQRGVSKLESLGLLEKNATSRNDFITHGRNLFFTESLKRELNKKSKELKILKEKNKALDEIKENKNADFNSLIKIILPHKCPNCGTKATTLQDANEIFGFRNLLTGIQINAYCKKCRLIT